MGPQMVDVQGRLGQNLNFLQHILQASNNVLEWIQIGYKLPVQYLPDPFSQSIHKSTLVRKSFVNEAVAELLANQCVKRVIKKPYICSPPTVVENVERQTTFGLKLKVFESVLYCDQIYYKNYNSRMLGAMNLE